jgi:hypothetical protein
MRTDLMGHQLKISMFEIYIKFQIREMKELKHIISKYVKLVYWLFQAEITGRDRTSEILTMKEAMQILWRGMS